MSYDAPFAGLKVVDLSQGVAGPCGVGSWGFPGR